MLLRIHFNFVLIGELSHEFYIGLFLGQFVFLYFVFDAILYHKKAGLIYRVTRSFCTNKGNYYSS